MSKQDNKKQSVAIIGMGCMFPRAADLKEFWRVLFNGEDAISDVPDTHWSVRDYFHSDPKHPDHTYCKKGGFLTPISYDPAEFGIPPNSLEATDTSQLLSLIVAKKALEDAGYGSSGKAFNRDKTSVILGATGTQELVIPLGARLGHPIWRKALKDSGIDADRAEEVMERISSAYVAWQENSFPGLLGNVIAGRITNRLDLGGTNCVVDAACASSMSAINLAVLELLSGRSDMSVTGGVDTLNDIFMHMCFSQTGVLSHTSNAMPFSEQADGTVLGEGIGILILKRLEDAERDGDRIYAVIRSMGSSSDGKSQSIYAPNAAGQAKALRMAYRDAEIDPGTIELIEAHGTGTRVGDAVEFSALKEVFRSAAYKGTPCALGSVKSNIGHSKAAAGAAGLIKAALALHHKVLPATLKAETPDPKLNIQETSFYLNSYSRPWVSRSGHPRRTGVSAFGFGGSNYHMVLEEYTPEKQVVSWDGKIAVAALSAENKEELTAGLSALQQEIAKTTVFEDVVRIVCRCNQSFSAKQKFRLALILERSDQHDNQNQSCRETIDNAVSLLQSTDTELIAEKNIYFSSAESKGLLAFLFPGQGSQYPDMGKDLISVFPQAAEAVEAFNSCHQAESGQSVSISDRIFPPPHSDKTKNEDNLRSTDFAQPAIGAVSLGMLNILSCFGLKPDAVCGHSYGELPALFAGGIISKEDMIALSVKRGKYMAAAGNGDSTMLAVKAPLEDIDAMIAEHKLDVILANRNAPQQGVLSGSIEAIEQAQKICKEKKFRAIGLPVAAAFHSKFVQKAAKPFMKAVKNATMQKPEIPVYANTTGLPYPDDVKQAATLLGEQLLNPVNFVKEIESLYETGVRTFVEVGPKSVLTGLVKAILRGREFNTIAMDASGGKKSGLFDLAQTLCQLAILGYEVDFTQWENPEPEPKPQKMSIPLSGANYRSPYNQKSPRPKTTAPKPAAEASPRQPEKPAATPAAPTPESADKPAVTRPDAGRTVQTKHTPDQPGSSSLLSEALQVVSESLKSMQALQIQTAETHKKFLETQTEASRNLQMMMERTRNMTRTAMGHPSQSTPVHPEPAIRPVSSPTPQMVTEPVIKTVPPSFAASSDKAVPEKPAPSVAQATTAADRDRVQKNMMDVVSTLTGYPADMLEPDMDIEADLGIDSIKRVEILSAFEEKMPGIPQVSTEIMGELKTLGQIIDYLVQLSGAADVSPPQAAAPNASATREQMQQAMMQVVSELTGYPVDMLELAMDIEADLGIDSIKRVEILSSFEEKMPGIPQVSTEIMGELKTLGQIIDYLVQLSGAADASPPQAAVPSASATREQMQQAMMQVVSELTGYPVDMLELAMDIEADLGIDSIKRVEILSSFEEKMPGIPQVSTEIMGELKTLGQIIDYIVALSGAADSSVSSPAFSAAVSAPASASMDQIRQVMMQVVSELTGYPVDMLEPAMDIEADLGIDSIKRVEILSSFEEKMPGLPAISTEIMGELKTLGQIIDYLTNLSPDDDIEDTVGSPAMDPDKLDVSYQYPLDPKQSTEEVIEEVERRVISLVEKPLEKSNPAAVLPDRIVYVRDDCSGLGREVAKTLEDRNIKTAMLAGEVFADRENMEQALRNAGGLVIIPDVDLLTDRFNNSSAWNEKDEQFLKTAFWAAHIFAQNQKKAGESSGIFATITRLDGMFGFSGRGVLHPLLGGLAGLVKTAAIEWEDICCHAIDVDPEWKDGKIVAQAVCDEILHRGPVEVCLSESSRKIPELIPAPAPEGKILLDENDVVIVTGGARGVTAACTYALARHARPTIILLGRSPLPAPEPDWLASLANESAMKKAILANEFSGKKATPVQVDSVFRKYMAGREIMKNLSRLKSAGSVVEYVPVDVRDAAAVNSLLAHIRSHHGPVSGIIHGAGVLEDRFIKDKTLNQFSRVFDTKAKGLQVLLEATAKDKLKYIVFFSSVAARIGNKGQVDYAMANEVLNKIAQQEALSRKNCRVVSINWGPWDGGMVTPSLKKEFSRMNISLIPVKSGALAMLYEMMGDRTHPVEVVIGATITDDRQPAADNPQTDIKHTMQNNMPPVNEKSDTPFEQVIDTRTYPILKAHVLNQNPVVPFAIMAEWFGHAALQQNPGFAFCGLDDMRLLSGIKLLNGSRQTIQLQSNESLQEGDLLKIGMELINLTREDKTTVHSKARAVLSAGTLPPPPAFTIPEKIVSAGYGKSIEECYETILFHGDQLKGIRKIIGYASEGMAAELTKAPAPQQWLSDPYRPSWITDPLILDAAYQMAILWCHATTGLVSLPSYSAKYRQYQQEFPQTGVTAVLEVKELTDHKMKGDFTFLNTDNSVVAEINGYEAIMDASLLEAFQKK